MIYSGDSRGDHYARAMNLGDPERRGTLAVRGGKIEVCRKTQGQVHGIMVNCYFDDGQQAAQYLFNATLARRLAHALLNAAHDRPLWEDW